MDEIVTLAKTIKRLLQTRRTAWVDWRIVSTEIDGTPIKLEHYKALAELPNWKGLFTCNNSVVKLTETGIRFADSHNESKLRETQLIAKAVKSYAAGLRCIELEILNVCTIKTVGTKTVQAIAVEISDEITPSQTPVEFRPKNRGAYTHGKIVGHDSDGGIIYVSFDRQIYPSDLPAKLFIDKRELLRQLAIRLENLLTIPLLGKSLNYGNKESHISITENDSSMVAHNLAALPIPWSKFLWGPPGAGKTYALGKLAATLCERFPEENILIVTPSNRSVDVAFEQFINLIMDYKLGNLIKARKLLRYGYPRIKGIIEKPELLGPANLDILSKKVNEISTRLNKAERNKAPSSELAVILTELLTAQEELKDAVNNHIKECRVVATTTTLAYLESSPVSKIVWDTVIVDEVTMVPPATCMFLASIAKKRILFAGDPQQLGPVYETSRSHTATEDEYIWMGKDVFEKSGLSEGFGETRQTHFSDDRLAIITSQRRCTSEIWSWVEHLYKGINNLTEDTNLKKIINLPPCAGKAVVVLDTYNVNGVAKCSKHGRSWQNEYTATLALEVASMIAAEADQAISIAIISPYRAQVQIINKLIRQEMNAEHTPYKKARIEAGTVHQFQGSGADIVIFDMVDGSGRTGLGNLLKGDTGIRLVNVALTRAKGKFILLVDRKWYIDNCESADNPILFNLIAGRRRVESLKVDPPRTLSNTIQRKQLESPIEEFLYNAFTEQYPDLHLTLQYEIKDELGNVVTRADFAFPNVKYAVYCDGKQWHLREDRWERDLRQRNKLAELGWVFSVFSGADLYRDAKKCAEQVFNTYKARKR
jgi:very-short-patch-repair endonuclease